MHKCRKQKYRISLYTFFFVSLLVSFLEKIFIPFLFFRKIKGKIPVIHSKCFSIFVFKILRGGSDKIGWLFNSRHLILFLYTFRFLFNSKTISEFSKSDSFLLNFSKANFLFSFLT